MTFLLSIGFCVDYFSTAGSSFPAMAKQKEHELGDNADPVMIQR
jgi:hypothetical protein